MSTVAGPDFIALQVRDIERAAEFYERELGLTRAPGPPHAVVFATQPIAFALRDPLRLAQHGVTILTEPVDGPFGRTFTLRDPDGYAVTIHDAG